MVPQVTARCLLLAFAVLANAANLPKPTGFVTDLADQLPATDRLNLEEKLRRYEQKTSNEIAVAIVNSLDGQSVEMYANRLFKTWGIGKQGRNNGVLLLWAVAERKVRIEVGLGLEPVISNDAAAAILGRVTTAFRWKDYTGGLNTGVDGIISRLDAIPVATGSPPPQILPPAPPSNSLWLPLHAPALPLRPNP